MRPEQSSGLARNEFGVTPEQAGDQRRRAALALDSFGNRVFQRLAALLEHTRDLFRGSPWMPQPHLRDGALVNDRVVRREARPLLVLRRPAACGGDIGLDVMAEQANVVDGALGCRRPGRKGGGEARQQAKKKADRHGARITRSCRDAVGRPGPGGYPTTLAQG